MPILLLSTINLSADCETRGTQAIDGTTKRGSTRRDTQHRPARLPGRPIHSTHSPRAAHTKQTRRPKKSTMRFREGATYPFLFADDDPNETTNKARIDLPRVASDADLALKKLAAGLGACADAQTELVKGGRRRTPEASLDGDERARRLFRIADPDSTGRCDEHRFTTLAESCGLNQEDARAALEACGGGPFVDEDAFVKAVGPHAEGRHHK